MTPSLYVQYITDRSVMSESEARISIWKAYDRKSYNEIIKQASQEQQADIIHDVIQHFDFMDVPDPSSVITDFDGSKSLFTKYMLYYPEPYMEFSSVLEFAIADDAYEGIIQSVQESDIEAIKDYSLRLLAILARPLSDDHLIFIKTGDRRVQLLSLAHAKDLMTKITTKKLPIYMHQAISYFTAVKKWINETYGEALFDTGESDEGESVTSSLKWHAHVAAVAEQGTFGSIDDVYQMNVHRFMKHLISKKEADQRAQPTTQPNYDNY